MNIENAQDSKQPIIPPLPASAYSADVTTGWEKTKGDNEIACHSRMIGGVLCRWWGDGEVPSGVEMLNAAFPPNQRIREKGE